jgi:hypothetical protein
MADQLLVVFNQPMPNVTNLGLIHNRPLKRRGGQANRIFIDRKKQAIK